MSKLQVSARAVFFSEAHGEGDRAREKRVKERAKSSERERSEENESAIEVGGKRERDVSSRQGNGGVPARTLNLLNALARA